MCVRVAVPRWSFAATATEVTATAPQSVPIRPDAPPSVLPVTAIKPAGEVAMPTPNGSAVIERNTKK